MKILREQNIVRTTGLGQLCKKDLLVTVATPDLVDEAENFLRHVIHHLRSGARLRPGDTLAYGYWMTEFVEAGDFLEAWERNADSTQLVRGATLTLTYWREQHQTCERLGASFDPPRPDRLVVISAGVLEGDGDLQGVRYPSPEHMTGWWLTTGRFDGNMKSLQTTHAYHVTAARPEIARLIALPGGYRFDLSRTEDVWFDQDVADERSSDESA